MYDKHDYSLFTSLTRIFKNQKVNSLLEIAGREKPFTFVDIGCGFSLRYTGHILFELARIGIKNVSVHVVDPALYGHGTHLAIGEIKSAFPSANFTVHPERWKPNKLNLSPGELQLTVAIQTTSLFNDTEFNNLHADLESLLNNNGLFVDISEVNDKVTDKKTYPYLNLYQRTVEQRISTASYHGFSMVCQTEMLAHAVELPDSQIISGMAFSKQRAK